MVWTRSVCELYQFVDEYIFIDYGKVVELIDHESLKNKIETNHCSQDFVAGGSGTLEEYFVNLIGENRKCIN